VNGSLPRFDLTESGLLLALVRGVAVAALFSGFGIAFFRAFTARRTIEGAAPPVADEIGRRLLSGFRLGQAVVVVALVLWLVLGAGAMSGTTGAGSTLAAVLPVLIGTSFGRLVAAQAGSGALALLVLGPGREAGRWRIAAALSGLAVLLQAGHGHGYAMYDGPNLLLASDALHVLCAAAWLGGLLPLLLVLSRLPPAQAAEAVRAFSRLGTLCVAGLVVTAGYQAWTLVGDPVGLIGTAYGWMVAVKACLFAGLLALAAANRFRLTPGLAGAAVATARRRLHRNVALEAGLGLAVVIAAALLCSLPPSIHTQPVWPFALRPSLETIAEDADFRQEVIGAILALAGALAALALGAAFRRLRWPAAALAALIAWFAVPHLGLLLVEAHPTSFYHSPTGFAAASIAEGAALYPVHCAACHGSEGRGDGPLAAGLPVPPADLTAEHLWGHSDGELFWWLARGIEAPEGGLAMPGFESVLDEDERWGLIDFIRARNEGIRRAAAGAWSPPIRAPEISASCTDGKSLAISELRGKVVRIAFADAATLPPAPPVEGGIEIVTLIVPAEGADGTGKPSCVVRDPAARLAYATLAGLPPAALDGTQFLVDPNGWLRQMQLPGGTVANGWDDPEALQASAVEICRHPILAEGGENAHHHGP
jgi:putative copper export protein/mono/diheme cytochrome c family protein